jgi:CheY-like chemotaxis protein
MQQESHEAEKIILVIDDTPSIRELITELLENLPKGHHVITFEDSEKAIDWLQANPSQVIDLVISDYNMGRINGAESLNQIRKLRPHIKSILMSATMAADLSQIARENLFDGYLIKPFVNHDIEVLVDRLLVEK